MTNKWFILWQIGNLALFTLNLYIGFHGINPANLIVAGLILGVALCALIERIQE